MSEVTQAVAAACIALSQGGLPAVAIEDVEQISSEASRNLVLRAAAVAGDGSRRAVVIKATRDAEYGPTRTDAFERFGIVREWAAVSLLASTHGPGRHGARFLAGDAARGVLVFADCGRDLASLAQPLMHGTAAQAEAALIACASAIGTLHADTVACQAAHAAAVRAAFPATHVPATGGAGWIERTAHKAFALLDTAPPEADIAVIAERLRAPGPWLALVHRDPCPDNLLLSDAGAIVLDYEFAAPGHVLLDGVYWRMGFPTCWCAGTIPAEVGARIDLAYRTALARGIPIAADDTAFRAEAVLLCAAWLLNSLAWFVGEQAMQEDSTWWGLASHRSRILHQLQAAIAATEEADILPSFRRLATAWHTRLRTAWPETPPLPLFACFKS